MGNPSLPTPVNPANALLQPVPYAMVAGTIETPQGTIGIVTIRHPAGEVTAYLTRDQIQSWERALHDLAAMISPSGLQVVRGTSIRMPDEKPLTGG
jgi:hypothetical protein